MDYFVQFNGEMHHYPDQMRELQMDFELLLVNLKECASCVYASRRILRPGNKEPLYTMGLKLFFKDGKVWQVTLGNFRDLQLYLLNSQLRMALLMSDVRACGASWEMFEPGIIERMSA